MTAQHVFYVYEHWRPDKDVCFYVGKGKNRRAWDMKGMRNRHHKAVTSKLTALGFTVDVRIVMKDLTSVAAIALEIDRIAFYGRENLTNMTAGGEGLREPAPEVGRAISRAHIERFKDPEVRRRHSEMCKKKPPMSAETRRKLSLANKGRKMSAEVRAKMSDVAKKRGVSPITREAQRKAVTGRPRVPHAPEAKERMRKAATGRVHTPETVEKMRASAIARCERERLKKEIAA
jgi:hypothetical protein